MTTIKYLAAVSAAALAISAAPVLAAGTAANTAIVNTANVNYQVNGVAQTAISASDTFIVDRLVNLVVAEVGNAATDVVPGQTGALTAFTLTNLSNATLDFALTATQLTSGTTAHGGTDAFNLTSLVIIHDLNGNGSVDPGEPTVTFIDELAADGVVNLLLRGNIPLNATNGQFAGVQLRATAREGGAVGTQGAALVQTTGPNTAAMDTVFADAASIGGDTARNAAHADDDDYRVVSAALAITKVSRIVSDPVNGTSNPKMIPGATVEYCIRVANSGGAAATNVAITDNLPSTLNFVTGTIRLNGTVDGATCNANGVAGGNFTDPEVSGTLASVGASDTRTLLFQTTVK